jgi:hypothetical protein
MGCEGLDDSTVKKLFAASIGRNSDVHLLHSMIMRPPKKNGNWGSGNGADGAAWNAVGNVRMPPVLRP